MRDETPYNHHDSLNFNPQSQDEVKQQLQAFERQFNCVLHKHRIRYLLNSAEWYVDGYRSHNLITAIANNPTVIRYIYPKIGPKRHDPKLITTITNLTGL